MINTEEVKIDETLPYGANVDDVLKLIDAIKTKQDNDKGIKQVYGKPNIENSRKVLKALGISFDGLNLSDDGRKYAYEIDHKKKELILLRLILKYPAYEYFLLNVTNDELSETSLENIQNYWGKHSYGNSENNRGNATTIFGQLIELSGLGTFKIGRKGKATRVEWNDNAQSLIRKTYSDISSENSKIEQTRTTESSSKLIRFNLDNLKGSSTEKNESDSQNTGEETELVREVLEKSFSNERQKNSLSKIDISVNIDMTEWDTEKITSFFKVTQGIFEDRDEL